MRVPADREDLHRKARRVAWISIVYLASAATLLALVMGDSQALKTEWVDDLVSIVPPLAFIASSRVKRRAPNAKFPYGYHRASTVAFFAAAVCLLGVGGYLLFDGVSKLVARERVTLGVFAIDGHVHWRGWLGLSAIAYSAVPAFFLGRAKRKLARKMSDLGLAADADMNRADAVSAGAAMIGIVGLGLGWWWADAAAAAVISLDLIWDGWTNVKRAVHQLMDERPETVDDEPEDLPDKIAWGARALAWVEHAAVRLRSDGGVLVGEVFVVPRGPVDVRLLVQATEKLQQLDDRLNLVVVPVGELPVANATA